MSTGRPTDRPGGRVDPLAVVSLAFGAAWPILLLIQARVPGLSLVAGGLFGIVGCWILAIVFGGIALVRIRRSSGSLRGRVLALTGLCLGLVPAVAAVGAAIVIVVVCNRPDSTCFEIPL